MASKGFRRRSYLNGSEMSSCASTNDSPEILRFPELKQKTRSNNPGRPGRDKLNVVNKDIEGILNKYNKQLGYNKKYHARSDAQTRMAALWEESPMDLREKIKRRASHEERRKMLDRSPDPYEWAEKGYRRCIVPILTQKCISGKRDRSLSRTLENKYQNIFQNPGSPHRPSL